MANIFREFFSEKDSDGNLTGSSKRLIAITTAMILIWGYIQAMVTAKTASERLYISIVYLAYVLVLVGVATFPQIITLFRGGSPAKDEGNTIDKPKE